MQEFPLLFEATCPHTDEDCGHSSTHPFMMKTTVASDASYRIHVLRELLSCVSVPGAVDEEGRMPFYAEECASMLAVTFSGGDKMLRSIVSTSGWG